MSWQYESVHESHLKKSMDNFFSLIWTNLGLGPKTFSFIQGQTLISAKAPHGGYPWRVDFGLMFDNFE